MAKERTSVRMQAQIRTMSEQGYSIRGIARILKLSRKTVRKFLGNPAAEATEPPVEQRWFIGAHSNVGGGCANDRLCNLPCRWIQKMAQRHGLEFLSDWTVGVDDYKSDPRDSYTEFINEYPQLDEIIE